MYGKFCTRIFSEIFRKFCTRKNAKKCRKFCNQVARVKSSENSEGGCIPGWDVKCPSAGKEKRDIYCPSLRFS